MFLKLPREENPPLDSISGIVFSQALSRGTSGVHLKAIHESFNLFIGIADMNEGRVPSIRRYAEMDINVVHHSIFRAKFKYHATTL